jgi:hypothetical protein
MFVTVEATTSVARDSLALVSPELAGLAEIAELLGVTKRTALNYSKRPDFPAPLDRLASGPVWNRRDVERWAKAHPLRPAGRRRS